MLNDIVSEILTLGEHKLLLEPNIAFCAFEQYLYTQVPSLKNIQNQPTPPHRLLTELHSSQHVSFDDYKVVIIGAGTAGLLIALALVKLGVKVDIFEKRTADSYNLRYPNISFKEGESTLKTLVGETVFQEFLSSGGSMDGKSGKLRLSIGSFQDIITKALKTFPNINLYFGTEFSFEQTNLYHDAHLVLLATGAHAATQFNLKQQLKTKRYSNFDINGQSALYVRPEKGKIHGYIRKDIEGYHWRRDNHSLYSGKAFTPDLLRLTRQVSNKEIARQLESFCDKETISYTFSFGNDTDHFFDNPPVDCDPLFVTTFAVKPQIALNLFFQFHNKDVLAIGDANGTPHPLAAIGTLKFVRNITHLINYIKNDILIRENRGEELSQLNKKVYTDLAMHNIREVFFSNIMSSIYSRPRV